MVRTTFSGREVISVLTGFGFVPQSHRGSHVRLRYENPDTGDVRSSTSRSTTKSRSAQCVRSQRSVARTSSGTGVTGSIGTIEEAAGLFDPLRRFRV